MFEAEATVMSASSTLTSSSLASVRVKGGADVRFVADHGVTQRGTVYEHGGYRVMFPRVSGRTEAVIVNTGGGMVGGDRVTLAFEAGPDASAVATSQSAERVYRSLGADTSVDVRLRAEAGASLFWLPQETILFSGGRLSRRLEADVAASATLLMSEIAIFGREAMGERVTHGIFCDSWRVRRDGQLVFAEALRLDGDIAHQLERPSVAHGCRVIATVLLVAPDAEERVENARAAFGEVGIARQSMRAGASAWNGLLLVRMMGARSELVRQAVARVIEALTNSAMPRVWAM